MIRSRCLRAACPGCSPRIFLATESGRRPRFSCPRCGFRETRKCSFNVRPWLSAVQGCSVW
ncbi:MAG: hypothetical protein EBX52_13120 [Proteobacteria bacterium]|nr:hypothetical protein [Pseudomonadota bacterium]